MRCAMQSATKVLPSPPRRKNQIRLFVVRNPPRISAPTAESAACGRADCAFRRGIETSGKTFRSNCSKLCLPSPPLCSPAFSASMMRCFIRHKAHAPARRHSRYPGRSGSGRWAAGSPPGIRLSSARRVSSRSALAFRFAGSRVHGTPLQRRADGAGQTVAPLVQQRRDSREA